MERNLKVDVGKSLFGKGEYWGGSVELKRCIGRIKSIKMTGTNLEVRASRGGELCYWMWAFSGWTMEPMPVAYVWRCLRRLKSQMMTKQGTTVKKKFITTWGR